MLVLIDDAYVAAALRIPKEKGHGAVAPSLGGSGAAFGGGASTSSTGARVDEVATPLATTLGCDTSASTHVGELSRAALRRSMRACRARWPERLLRWVGGVGVSGLASGGRSSMSKLLPVATKSRLPNRSTVPTGSGRGLFAIQEKRERTKTRCHATLSLSGAPTVGVLTRRSGTN